MSASVYILFCVLLASAVTISSGNRVLFIPSSIYPNHKIVMYKLAAELTRRGHSVSVWSVQLKQDSVAVPDGVQDLSWFVDVPEAYIRNMFLYGNASVYNAVWKDSVSEPARKAANWAMTLRMCEVALHSRREDFEALVASSFDLVILDDLYAPCGLLLTALKKSVFIYWSMTYMRTETAWSNQSPSPPSYIPVPGTEYTDAMDFTQRFYNFLSYLKTLYIHQRIVLRSVDSLFKKFYPTVPDAYYIERNASLNFINTPPLFDFPRPYMPRVVFVGGLHCHSANPLPPDLDEFVRGATNGFLLFTTGLSVQWDRSPMAIRTAFVEAFRSLPHRFVWQYDGQPPNDLPANVLVRPWLPQQDLLGHPKCRGFITHGGLNSVVESMWHGVPLIGIPVYADHRDNILRATARNAGIMLRKSNVSKETIAQAIRTLDTNDLYRQSARGFKELLQDVPYTELQHAAFWVEFAFRHGEVPHARSGADDLNLLQYFLVDVIVFLLACLVALAVAAYYTMKYAYQICSFCGGIMCRLAHTGRSALKRKTE